MASIVSEQLLRVSIGLTDLSLNFEGLPLPEDFVVDETGVASEDHLPQIELDLTEFVAIDQPRLKPFLTSFTLSVHAPCSVSLNLSRGSFHHVRRYPSIL